MDQTNLEEKAQLPFPNRQPLRYIDIRCRPDCFNLSKRYTIALLIHIGFIIAFAARSNTCIFNENENRNILERASASSIFVIAFMFVQLPGALLSCKYSATKIFGLCTLSNALVIFFAPLFVLWLRQSLYIFAFLRGIFQGIMLPAMYAVWTNWAPPNEHATLLTISYSGTFVGILLGDFLSRVTCPIITWHVSQYFYGLVGIIWYFFWIWLVFDNPKVHPTILDNEFLYLENVLENDVNGTRSVPWLKIFTSLPFFALMLVYIIRSWTVKFLAYAELAQFIFIFDEDNMFFIILVTVLSILMPLVGLLCDFILRKTSISRTNLRKLFICGGFLLIILVRIPRFFGLDSDNSRAMYYIECIAEIVFYTLVIVNVYVNHLDISGKFAPITLAISNIILLLLVTVESVDMLLISLEFISPQDTTFLAFLSVIIHLTGLVFFGLFGSAENQGWNKKEPPTGTN